MIRGQYLSRPGRRQPFIDVTFQFPILTSVRLDASLLVDTGAERTILAPVDALRLEQQLGIRIAALPIGRPSIGVGGRVATRSLPATVILDTVELEVLLTVLEAPITSMSAIPSILGRDVLAHFALFLEERTDR